MSGEAERVEHVVCGVMEAALAESGAAGLLVLDDRSPEGELVCGWLERRVGQRVQRAGALASNMQGVDAGHAGGMLLVHPVNRTMLLLGGAVPRADLLPLGDVHASWAERLTGACTLSDEVRAAADAVGGVARLDALLADWIDGRATASAAFEGVDRDAAAHVIALYERGRYYRLRPRVVPKLGTRTLGIDLWD